MKKVTDVLIVGGGCAGWLAAVNFKAKLPSLNVRLLAQPLVDDFNPDGFAVTPPFLEHLHSELNLPAALFLRAARPTWTLGTRYHQLGPRDFFDYTYEFQIDTKYGKLTRETGAYVNDSPRAFEAIGGASALISAGRMFHREKDGSPRISLGRYGYNLEHKPLVAHFQQMAAQVGVVVVEGRMAEAIAGADGISDIRLESGETLKADLYIDATGLQSLLLGKAMGSTFHSFAPALACDAAIVASCPRQERMQPATTVRPTPAGWCWRLDTTSMVTCGHAFSTAHADAVAAEKMLREQFPQAQNLRLLRFRQGRYDKAWSGNVIGIGSAAGFVEPLTAASSAVVSFACQFAAQTLVDCDQVLRPTLIKQFNKRWQRLIEGEREFLGLIYRHNTRTEPFWQQARQNAHIGELELVERCYLDLGPDSVHRFTLLHENDPFNLEGYFSVLIGMGVPWNKRFEPTAEELATWQIVQDTWRRKAEYAFTAEELLRAMLTAQPPAGASAAPKQMVKPMQSMAL